MTRYEAVKSMSKKDMATFLCDLWLLSSDPVAATGCEYCPMAQCCRTNHNGWIDFLNGEWDDKYTTGAGCENFIER